MFDIGVPELVLILVIILVLFGGKKLPELSKSIAQAIRELRGGFADEPKKDSDEKKKEEK